MSFSKKGKLLAVAVNGRQLWNKNTSPGRTEPVYQIKGAWPEAPCSRWGIFRKNRNPSTQSQIETFPRNSQEQAKEKEFLPWAAASLIAVTRFLQGTCYGNPFALLPCMRACVYLFWLPDLFLFWGVWLTTFVTIRKLINLVLYWDLTIDSFLVSP